jgi:inner membrane protein
VVTLGNNIRFRPIKETDMDFNPAIIWFLIGLGLVLSEFMLPGIILVFFGLGAWVVALGAWIGILNGTNTQLLTFGISSVLLLVFLRRYFQNRFIGFVGDAQVPSENIDDFSGQPVTVISAIQPDQAGRVEYKGAGWKATSDVAIPEGASAVIESVEGITLRVKPANS